MNKLDLKDFKILKQGLKALANKHKNKSRKEKTKILKSIRDAEFALISIGIY